MASVLSFAFMPAQLNAAPTTNTVVVADMTDAAKAKALYARLDEIKNMDKTNLTSPQKKELRKELRDIRQQLSHIGGGVYISAAALIVILILLLILL